MRTPAGANKRASAGTRRSSARALMLAAMMSNASSASGLSAPDRDASTARVPSRTSTKVENNVSRANELLERAQAHRRCRVLARPERHSWIDLYHDLAALQPVMRPRRLDDES